MEINDNSNSVEECVTFAPPPPPPLPAPVASDMNKRDEAEEKGGQTLIMASDASWATTVFDFNFETSFEEFGQKQKLIAAKVKVFVDEWRSVSELSKEEWEADDEVFERVQNVDVKRQEIAFNVKAWVQTALESLHVEEDHPDRIILRNMFVYVERVRKQIEEHPFLLISSSEAEEFCVLPDEGDEISLMREMRGDQSGRCVVM